MPLYTAITQERSVSDETKAKIAEEITRIHATLMYNPLNPWGKHRELPAVPRQTFHQWYLENRRKS